MTLIYDPRSDYFYVCLDNIKRIILDLHGKKYQNEKGEVAYDGRGLKQACQETLDFIIGAYTAFHVEATVLTGRGKHVSATGKRGVLNKGFQEWIKDKSVAHLIERYSPIAGKGGYKIIFQKPVECNLESKKAEDALPILKKS